MERTTNNELKIQINTMQETLNEVRVIVRGIESEMSEVNGRICVINERCKNEAERIACVEERNKELDQKMTNTIFTAIGALITGALALVGLIFKGN